MGEKGALLRLKFGGTIGYFAIVDNVRCLLEGALDISTVIVGALLFFTAHPVINFLEEILADYVM